jgi:ADP-ribose pyrophosphatase YjhB (NUDIX family)
MKHIEENYIKSAGLVIIQNNKILLAHPTNAAWEKSYSIPKGIIENNESTLSAAIRETAEEVGIVNIEKYINHFEYEIPYINNKGKLYKKVYYYVAYLPDNYLPDVLPKSQLQLSEVDWAGFLDLYTAKEKIASKLNEVLKEIS